MRCLLLLLLLLAPVWAQSQRERAFDLVKQGQYAEAVPLLERLGREKPDDGPVFRQLGFALNGLLLSLKTPEERKPVRLRARAALQRAAELGQRDALTLTMLEGFPEDGGEPTLSPADAEVAEVMRTAEVSFAKSDYAAAIADYQKALGLRPNLYEAALYTGDCYFRQKQWAPAEEWFQKAVAIQPGRETAHRYWGDCALHQGKALEARGHYLDAVLAEPYSRLSWLGLRQWADANGFKAAHPLIPADGRLLRRDGDRYTVLVNQSDPLAKFQMVYAMMRIGQAQGETRHSLEQERKALDVVAESALEEVQKGAVKADGTWLATLIRLKQANLLDSYVLLARPDEGIAQDYAAYREAHRALLQQYLEEVYLKKP